MLASTGSSTQSTSTANPVDLRRPERSLVVWAGSRIQQDDRRSQKDLEETQHPQPPTIQIDALAGVLRGLCFFEMQGWILLWCMAWQKQSGEFADFIHG